jgi:predicted RNase H-like HicB family nuclease
MRYPIVIEPGDPAHAFGVVVPDLPGCFSAGDTLDEAISHASDAILFHVEGLLDAGEPVPEPTSMEAHRTSPEFTGWLWAVVEVDISKLQGKAQRVNITLPKRLLARIDQAAADRHETRSGFLAQAALRYMQDEGQTGVGAS